MCSKYNNMNFNNNILCVVKLPVLSNFNPYKEKNIYLPMP